MSVQEVRVELEVWLEGEWPPAAAKALRDGAPAYVAIYGSGFPDPTLAALRVEGERLCCDGGVRRPRAEDLFGSFECPPTVISKLARRLASVDIVVHGRQVHVVPMRLAARPCCRPE